MATYRYDFVGPTRPGDRVLPKPDTRQSINIPNVITPPKSDILKKITGGGSSNSGSSNRGSGGGSSSGSSPRPSQPTSTATNIPSAQQVYNEQQATPIQQMSNLDKVTQGATPKTPQQQILAFQQQNPNERLIFNQQGQPTGIESRQFGQSMSIDEYNKEIKRIEDKAPKERFLNPTTGQTFEKKQTVKFGEVTATSTPDKIYVDPETGKPIENIGEYYKKNRIPVNYEKPNVKVNSAQELMDVINKPQTYDLLSIESSGQRTKVGTTIYNPTFMESGQVTPVVEGSNALIKGIPKIYLQTLDSATSMGSTIYSKVTGKPTDIIYSDILPKNTIERLDYKPAVRSVSEEKPFISNLASATRSYFDKDVATTYGVAVSVGIGSSVKSGAGAIAYIAEPLVTRSYEKLDKRFLPQPKSIGGKFIKGVGEGILFASLGKMTGEFIGGAFASNISKSLMVNPIETSKELATSPETYGFIVGGGIGKGLRKIPYSKIKLTRTPLTQAELKRLEIKKAMDEGTYNILDDAVITPERITTAYHGTTTQSAKRIKLEGLKPKDLGEVYLTESKDLATGFAGRAVSKTGFKDKPAVLQANIPESYLKKNLVERQTGIGGVDELSLKKVDAKYFGEKKEYYSLSYKEELVNRLQKIKDKYSTPQEIYTDKQVLESLGRYRKNPLLEKGMTIKQEPRITYTDKQVLESLKRFKESDMYQPTIDYEKVTNAVNKRQAEILTDKLESNLPKGVKFDFPTKEFLKGQIQVKLRNEIPEVRQLAIENLKKQKLLKTTRNLLDTELKPVSFQVSAIDKPFEKSATELALERFKEQNKQIVQKRPAPTKKLEPITYEFDTSLLNPLKNRLRTRADIIELDKSGEFKIVDTTKKPTFKSDDILQTALDRFKETKKQKIKRAIEIIREDSLMQEVKSGNQVLIQQLEQPKVITKQKQKLQYLNQKRQTFASRTRPMNELKTVQVFAELEKPKTDRSLILMRKQNQKSMQVLSPRQLLSMESLEGFNIKSAQKEIQLLAQPLKSKQKSGQLFAEAQLEKLIPKERQRYVFDRMIFGNRKLKILKEDENKKKRFRQARLYQLLIKRKGKFVPVATNLTKQEAVIRLQSNLLSNIARTGKIVPTGRTREVFGIDQEIMPDINLFRGYKVRRGKAIPLVNTFIQRNSANLKTFEEKESLRQSRLMRNLLS